MYKRQGAAGLSAGINQAAAGAAGLSAGITNAANVAASLSGGINQLAGGATSLDTGINNFIGTTPGSNFSGLVAMINSYDPAADLDGTQLATIQQLATGLNGQTSGLLAGAGALNAGLNTGDGTPANPGAKTVSYTHLDVYKRQPDTPSSSAAVSSRQHCST